MRLAAELPHPASVGPRSRLDTLSPTNPPLPFTPCLWFTRCRGQRIRQMQRMVFMIQSRPIFGHGGLPGGAQTTYLYSAVPGDPNLSST